MAQTLIQFSFKLVLENCKTIQESRFFFQTYYQEEIKYFNFKKNMYQKALTTFSSHSYYVQKYQWRGLSAPTTFGRKELMNYYERISY